MGNNKEPWIVWTPLSTVLLLLEDASHLERGVRRYQCLSREIVVANFTS